MQTWGRQSGDRIPTVAIVGAGGLVGRRVLSELARSDIEDINIIVTGRQNSAGSVLEFRGRSVVIEVTDVNRLREADIVILATPSGASKELVSALEGGPTVVDISSAFRTDPDVPLVVPEVNADTLKDHRGLIAGPNCSTIQLVMVLWPLHQKYTLKRVHVATYQSVSGAGYQAVSRLEEETFQRLCPGQRPPVPSKGEFPHPIGFNLIPQIDSFLDDGYTKEEMKMVNESRKIMGIPDLRMSTTCVRAPVFIGHSEACFVEFEREPDVAEVRELIKNSPGLVLMDDPEHSVYPMPVMCEDTDLVYVGRIRKDLASPNGLLFWVVADNLLIGAATNAVRIAKRLLESKPS